MWAASLAWATAIGLVLGLVTLAVVLGWSRLIDRDRVSVMRLIHAWESAASRRDEAERMAVAALAASARRHRALAEAGATAIWIADAEGRLRSLDGAWIQLTGQAESEMLGSDLAWLLSVHEEDRRAAGEAWLAAIAAGQVLEAEFRILTVSGATRWYRARAVPIREERTGAVVEWIGVVEDVDDRRRADAERALLAREVDHRAKNLLAVVQAVLRMANAGQASLPVVTERIGALARAHDLLAAGEWSGAGLREIAERELAPYLVANGGPRALLSGPRVILAPAAAQPMAMLLHELATNAVKHGALGQGGEVRLDWDIDNSQLRLRWVETGARLPGPPARRGFGSRLIESTVNGQLGGTFERAWLAAGLECRIALPLHRVTRAETMNDAPASSRVGPA